MNDFGWKLLKMNDFVLKMNDFGWKLLKMNDFV
ncbi:hypothetical protein T03_11306 [Trichinella britovi]|uniref:Uncharacterized protein n=1 Tax=Trichinella britovi TaxID=45882 RepID=A0A0V1B0E1_TRIBR|nr:hypothetical protein T03_11306 [Trichinella britovi]